MDKKAKNNWYAISGAVSSGKTTIINLLEKMGFKVVHESATELIEKALLEGKTAADLRKYEASFQRKVLEIKLHYESQLNPNDTVFIDRGIPDSVAFYKEFNVPIDDFLNNAVKNCWYKKVFLFEPLQLVRDQIRIETEKEQHEMDKLNEEAYRNLGLTIVKVPVMSIDDRLQFISNNL